MDAFSKLMNSCHQVRGKVFNMENKLEWIKSLLTMKMYDVELKGLFQKLCVRQEESLSSSFVQ